MRETRLGGVAWWGRWRGGVVEDRVSSSRSERRLGSRLGLGEKWEVAKEER